MTGISFTESDVNRYSPTFSGTASASWTLPFHPADGDVILNGDLFMTADFGGQYGEKLPGYHLVNASLTFTDVTKRWNASLGVKNLTEEVYLGSGYADSFGGITEGVYGRPREWYLSARYAF